MLDIESRSHSFIPSDSRKFEPTTQLETRIHDSKPLSELGVALQAPHERKDKGSIEYTSPSHLIENWAKDPTGTATFRFFSEAYGIPADKTEDVLASAGMSEYLKYKAEGRFIGFSATQILKPSHYFLTNALMLGAIHRREIPTAYMVFETPQDNFYSENSDKGGAFGSVEFPVGVNKDDNSIESEEHFGNIQYKGYEI